ncbi:MAG: glutamate-1-semialdehyde 2,1-aminomutase [Burkholderiales bacterium]|jgi:glutamate-1-semialdehyde 2,1-aminomutase|nr:glutamate-1-semialdehyde 2,1-aminomutase [Burkholderiales bacterium]MCA3160880.1 glutamate-1-semialdehyde 2,1-aminomutase [Burkholderiales bacterium]MCA3163669.1 glutamate-1-semialdehyde 2,1-aminomutase [Burkholderiales bacterium]MCA3166562.1 glutamate-1-semialdehyde 2,1-aminomutase [Burkholderiales bacterium]MCA3170027.1 glutamate-1-semialdehyde 2,1-aminomutase [Burkholderiales bacterium]
MSQNDILFERAQRSIPGGVNSPVRAFKSVGGTPRFFTRGQGPYVWDADGQRYVDYIGSWGPMILGHAHPQVVEAVQRAAHNSLSFGAPTEAEIEIAEEVLKLVPSIKKVRFVSSGTEATMSAIRLARGATGRSKIIKFDGCYHGHADSLLVKAGSGLLTFGHPTSAGVPAEFAAHTVVLSYNDMTQLEQCFSELGKEVSCVIVEPIAGNMNLVRAQPQWLRRMRELCTQHGAILIFDEVMSGFRVALGGAQSLYGIQPDLTTLGKVIGGGLPVAAFGGREDIMHYLAPLGPVYQAGTLSGNPVAVAAGLTTLKLIQASGFFECLTEQTQKLCNGLTQLAQHHGITLTADSVGGMFGLYFADQIPRQLSDVSGSDIAYFNRFFHAMLTRGVYLAPSAYEAGFVSIQHDNSVIEETLASAQGAFKALG